MFIFTQNFTLVGLMVYMVSEAKCYAKCTMIDKLDNSNPVMCAIIDNYGGKEIRIQEFLSAGDLCPFMYPQSSGDQDHVNSQSRS